jgi:lambda family phage portal protein
VKKVELNLIDKAIAFVNPQAAVERLASRAKLTAFEYDATQYNRQRRGPSSLSGAEGFRSNYDRVELLKRSRDLAENVGLVRGLLMKFASHCAGNISYQARTESPKVNSDVEAYWNEWWDKCDLSGRHTGSFLMQIAMMSMLRDGDFLFVLVRTQDGTLKLQGIEADRLGDPNRTYTSLNLISGIHIDQETGAPIGYDIYLRTYGNAYIFQTTVPASQAFHLYDPLRIDQYRGISAFHTAINDCVDIYEIIASEKMAAKYASSQAGIVKRNNNNASDLSALTNDLNADNQGIKLETIEPGKVSYLEVNEDIIFPDGPSRPSGAFAEFHKILLRNICMGVGIPYSFAVDPSSMSGPTARLEMQQAGRTFRRYQKLLEDRVLRPLKNIVIADGVARGLIANNLGGKSAKGIFNFGANVSIDLGRESQANIAEFRAGLTNASQIYSEKGLDFESSIRQRALEAKLIDDLAKQYGVQPNAISDTILGSISQPSQDQTQASDQTTPQADQTYVADQALNGAQVASLIQVINAVASGAISKEGSVSIITAAFPFISPDEASKIVEGINIGTIAPSTKTPTPTQAIPEKMEDEPQDENAVVVVPPIKEQDTASRTTGSDGDIDVGEEREPTEKGATEDTQKIGGKQIDNNLEELSKLDNKSVKMLINGILNACELGKYSDIDFTPPQGAREAAKRALEVRGEKPASQRGMTSVGIARARDLIAGKSLSPDTIRRMHSFFSRHEVDKKGEGWDDKGKGWQAWNGWGGDAGFSWVKKLIKQMDSRDEKLEEPASCPIATQDIKTNLANRQNAVDDANYGPANPNESNDSYWKAKADEFQGDVATAKKMRCGNCAAFNQTNKLLGCIKKGIGEDANEVAVGGDLGYCEIFDFKCAAKRTCDAWIVGGPIKDKSK